MVSIKERIALADEKAFVVINNPLTALSQGEDLLAMPTVNYPRETICRIRNLNMGYIVGGVIDTPKILKKKTLKATVFTI